MDWLAVAEAHSAGNSARCRRSPAPHGRTCGNKQTQASLATLREALRPYTPCNQILQEKRREEMKRNDVKKLYPELYPGGFRYFFEVGK